MDIETFKAKKNSLRQDYLADLSKLATEYAMANNQVEVNDIIVAKSSQIIRVEKIEVAINRDTSIPYCIYIGNNCRRSGTPMKGIGADWRILQPDLTEIVGKTKFK